MNNETADDARMEARYMREIEETSLKISLLEQELKILRRLLSKARSNNKITKSVNRKNSLDRAMVEACINDSLLANSPLRSDQLRKHVNSVAPSMKDNTFRSYLHRMKEKGLIANHNGNRGIWELPKK